MNVDVLFLVLLVLLPVEQLTVLLEDERGEVRVLKKKNAASVKVGDCILDHKVQYSGMAMYNVWHDIRTCTVLGI